MSRRRSFMLRSAFSAVALALGCLAVLTASAAPVTPDIVVAADGTGDFTTVHAAVQSLPRDNRDRRVILVRNGTYTERVRVDAPRVTLRGESRTGVRLAFAHARTDSGPRDPLGAGVLNLAATAHDFVLENLTVENTHGQLGVHAFAVYGRADRTVIVDCDLLSRGNDTLSLWRGRAENRADDAGTSAAPPDGTPILSDGGRYYHARLRITGSVDFVCPRGWCYTVDSTLIQLNPAATAAVWHDGSGIADKKFVLRGCRFDGPPGWTLARRHHDGQFYFIDCSFSAAMRDRAPYRVTYPLDGGTPTEADRKRNADYDRTNQFADRNYFHGSRRAGGDFPWHRDNLASAPGSPAPAQITAAWTFGGTWDPERTDAPKILGVTVAGDRITLLFSEPVSVKGRPVLALRGGSTADFDGGSGSRRLVFVAPPGTQVAPLALEFAGGGIVAAEAYATLRAADPALP